MRASVTLVVVPWLALACTHALGEGEGEGEGGEGEGAPGEGEGAVGEGEGAPGEGEGAAGEGEGAAGEGEGAAGEGEGEGEGAVASGCIDDVSAGDHAYTCRGFDLVAHVPSHCPASGCGLILELHGDTGDGPLIEQHMQLFPQGEAHGYVVIAPTGPPRSDQGSTWFSSNDAALVALVQDFAAVFRVDARKVHVTGFSRGGFVTWRLICDHSDLFASAAPGAAGDGSNFGEPTCFVDGRTPAHHIPIAFLVGRTDASVGYSSLTAMRDAVAAVYGTGSSVVVDSDATYHHDRFQNGAALLEVWDHTYETDPNGPWGFAQGHCIPGSSMDPFGPQYALPCAPPNSFTWGDQVMQFFIDHPAP